MSLDCLPEHSIFTVTGTSKFLSTSPVFVGKQSGLSLPQLFFSLVLGFTDSSTWSIVENIY